MKKSMFAFTFLFSGLIVGYCIHALVSVKPLHASSGYDPGENFNVAQHLSTRLSQYQFSGSTAGIKRNQAYQIFKDYHKSETPAGSRGCLKTNVNNQDEAIISVFLSDSLLLSPLKAMVEDTLNKTFVGLAGIPGYLKNRNSNTIMWIAIIEDLDDEGNKVLEYLLPSDSDSTNTSLIFDYVDVCPDLCPENAERLWNRNWEE